MTTSNEQIRDDLLRHQVYLMRLSAFYGNSIIAGVDKTIPMLMEEINSALIDIEDMGGYAPTRRVNKRLNEMEKTIKELRFAGIELQEDWYTDEMSELAKKEPEWVAKIINTALPVVLVTKFLQPSDRALNNIINYEQFNGQNIKQWFASLKAGDVKRINQRIRTGLRDGESISQIQKSLRGTKNAGFKNGVLNTTRNGTKTLTRSVTNGVANSSRSAMYTLNSEITGELFVATLDSRTTKECSDWHGSVFDPGEGVFPPLHRNCRSVRTPIYGIVLKAKYPKSVINKVGGTPHVETFHTWLNKEGVEFQNDLLGRVRAQEWRAGRLKIDKMVDKSGKTITLEELGLTVK